MCPCFFKKTCVLDSLFTIAICYQLLISFYFQIEQQSAQFPWQLAGGRRFGRLTTIGVDHTGSYQNQTTESDILVIYLGFFFVCRTLNFCDFSCGIFLSARHLIFVCTPEKVFAKCVVQTNSLLVIVMWTNCPYWLLSNLCISPFQVLPRWQGLTPWISCMLH